MVVIVNDLDLYLELVDLSLHQLLSNLCEELKVELDEAIFHDLLAELNRLFLSLFNDLPELVGEGVRALVHLLFSLVVLTEVRVLIREAVEALDKVVKNSLLAIACVKELEERCLQLRLLLASLLPL